MSLSSRPDTTTPDGRTRSVQRRIGRPLAEPLRDAGRSTRVRSAHITERDRAYPAISSGSDAAMVPRCHPGLGKYLWWRSCSLSVANRICRLAANPFAQRRPTRHGSWSRFRAVSHNMRVILRARSVKAAGDQPVVRMVLRGRTWAARARRSSGSLVITTAPVRAAVTATWASTMSDVADFASSNPTACAWAGSNATMSHPRRKRLSGTCRGERLAWATTGAVVTGTTPASSLARWSAQMRRSSRSAAISTPVSYTVVTLTACAVLRVLGRRAVGRWPFRLV